MGVIKGFIQKGTKGYQGLTEGEGGGYPTEPTKGIWGSRTCVLGSFTLLCKYVGHRLLVSVQLCC